MHVLGILPIFLFLAAALVATLYPRLLVRLVNFYYSKLGMKTRVAEEDYEHPATRIAGAMMLLAGCFLAYRWIFVRQP
jgi:hypothetical protein